MPAGQIFRGIAQGTGNGLVGPTIIPGYAPGATFAQQTIGFGYVYDMGSGLWVPHSSSVNAVNQSVQDVETSVDAVAAELVALNSTAQDIETNTLDTFTELQTVNTNLGDIEVILGTESAPPPSGTRINGWLESLYAARGELPYTFTDGGNFTVGAVTTVLLAAAAGPRSRQVMIVIPTATTAGVPQTFGIHLNFGAVATPSNGYYPPGVYTFDTNQSINGIRPTGATADIQVSVNRGVPAL